MENFTNIKSNRQSTASKIIIKMRFDLTLGSGNGTLFVFFVFCYNSMRWHSNFYTPLTQRWKYVETMKNIEDSNLFMFSTLTYIHQLIKCPPFVSVKVWRRPAWTLVSFESWCFEMDARIIFQFTNCVLLRDHAIQKEDLWVRDGKIINPEKVFFDEKVIATKKIDCLGTLITPGFIDLQINGL